MHSWTVMLFLVMLVLLEVKESYGQRRRTNSLLPEECGIAVTLTDRIFGGSEPALDSSPWLALVEYEDKLHNSNIALCGGSIISERYVISAAHCIILNSKLYSPPYRVRLGEHDLSTEQDCRVVDEKGTKQCNDPPVFIAIESYACHEEYKHGDKSHHNDIALIRVKKPMVWTEYIAPICLPVAKDTPKPPTVVFAAGWGRTENGSSALVKQELETFIVAKEACEYAFKSYDIKLSAGQLCAGGQEGSDTCQGDSGGPLMTIDDESQTWKLVGVVSFGLNNCGTYAMPGIYTNVAYYVNWIKARLKP